MHKLDSNYYINGIINGNISQLSKAITLIESSHNKHFDVAQKIIKGCLPKSGNSFRIGITGVPGAGKSTFIEVFGNLLTEKGKKVAVLTVDPSSSISKGSILGDKTRMETLVQNPNVYIRPSASGNHLGGVAQKTRESIFLCEAAGFDVILIETVGVGQSETEVHSMVDFFLMLQIAGAGDELQGIKRGIMEMCDAIIVNKADGENVKWANIAQQNLINVLHLFNEKENNWTPKVLITSALEKKGIEEIWNLILEFETFTKNNNSFETHRIKQDEYWLYETINQLIKKRLYENNSLKNEIKNHLQDLHSKKSTPYEVANELWDNFVNKP